MVADAPDISGVMKAFVEFCGDDVLIGHNLLFDFSFAKNMPDAAGSPLKRRNRYLKDRPYGLYRDNV